MAKKEYTIKDLVIIGEDMRSILKNILKTLHETIDIIDRINTRMDQIIKRSEAIAKIHTS